MPDSVSTALAAVTGALPAAEDRPGQREMAIAVGNAVTTGRHLVVQAGTGTGKTIGYLVPAVLAGKTVVVATATKALQDQLAAKDLPFLQQHLGIPFDWAVLKGRSNYVCMQRVREIQNKATGQLELEESLPPRRSRSTGWWHGRPIPTAAIKPRSHGHPATARGRQSASAAMNAPAQTVARWAASASRNWLVNEPPSLMSSSSTCTCTGCT